MGGHLNHPFQVVSMVQAVQRFVAHWTGKAEQIQAESPTARGGSRAEPPLWHDLNHLAAWGNLVKPPTCSCGGKLRWAATNHDDGTEVTAYRCDGCSTYAVVATRFAVPDFRTARLIEADPSGEVTL